MKTNIRWGLTLGAIVAAVTLTFALTGLHQRIEASVAFLVLAIGANIWTVIMCLRAQASTSSWGQQILNGLVLGAAASVVIFLSSWLVTGVIFPEYFAEMAEGYRGAYEAMGMSASEVDEMVAATAATSPAKSAFDGVVGTMATSLILSAIAGFWIRKKD
ncbi:MAG: DUF4199 family protein [Rhodothermales bacterium]|nr:DUF4199 family protein [Rhodothermales bacterium]